MIDTPIKTYFHLSFKIAFLASFGAFFVFSAVLNIHLPLKESMQYGFITSVGLLFVIYFVTRAYLKSRFERVHQLLDAIANKNFDEHPELLRLDRDELDRLIKQILATSAKVELEIQRLNRLENYRKEFIGDISHELKTPIFAVQGFLETLLDGALEDPRVNRQFLTKALNNLNRLTILTQDLMAISKLETGELRSELQKFPLRSVVNEVVESLQPTSVEDNISLKILPFDKEIKVIADRNQFKQVMVNLIENAIKYNKSGGSILVGIKPYTSNPSKVLVYVKDSGLGISAEDIPRVTERFFRIDKSRSREKGGTGLGLSIVKHIVEAHGEKLFIESVVNEGTTFSFTLQVSNPEILVSLSSGK
ncbi:MAG: hypothetical protein JJU41_04015 [Bacteroidetes bacterium]|nr:hypothetical protein [Bacteroidota bacterium]MCH8523226.1 hypothetical protein [Balneolales bacterium]